MHYLSFQHMNICNLALSCSLKTILDQNQQQFEIVTVS